ncbi:hypothetical protein HJC23_008469 [Cyclotella cryptica]|uniref:rRNA-processing protein EFG1 n=1 Tax=Cyclotella cryptica TaxID=29204 RepID=A0ABD3QW30_9STRA|eukprot:CCRYP_001195-RB/>CCRYP_001195-RB protein AED:0.08 eAED:0.08 QI:1132/1/1/1/0.33/0.25/4/229/486
MRPKQYSKFKPWRKGKSAEKRLGAAAGGKKMSLKNRLRGQRRLLAKLMEKGEIGDALEGVKVKIAELEKEVKEREARELEKKNATKYHQVKFIERQKVTRLEKSIQRQLQKLKEEHSTDSDKEIQEQIAKLQAQLNATAMDQLYIAFYPADVKYMSLFTNGMQRAVDDERGQNRRRKIWNRIREGLLNDLKKEKEDCEAVEEEETKEKKAQFDNAKNWVNLDAAKKALLSMPEDTYPNAPSLLPIVSKSKPAKRETTENKSAAKATVTDNRFVFSKELDGLFHESTTGDDYEKEVETQEAIQTRKDDDDSTDSVDSSDSDDNDTSSEDDADPLKAYDESKDVSRDKKDPSSDNDEKVAKSTNAKVGSEEDSSSSSDDDSSSSDSESDAVPPKTKGNADNNFSMQNKEDDAEEDDDDDQDDFFTTEKLSAEDVFAQAQQQHHKERASDDHYSYQKKRSDKSKGFVTQNQTKREFRNFQHRKKRSKFS